jgi:tetratricopeptide (TPR) repeat protein
MAIYRWPFEMIAKVHMRSFLAGLAAAAILWTSASANDFTDCGEALKLKAGNEVTAEIKAKADPVIAACTRLLQHPPKGFDSQGVFVFRGYAWYAVHEYDKAIADYTSAINLNGATSNAFVAYRVRAAAWADKNELDLAVADNQAALKLNPKAFEIHHNQANIWRLLKKPENALAELNLAIGLNPKFAESYNSRGILRDELGQPDAALSDFNEVIRLSPSAKAYAIRGNHWRLMGDLDKALQDQDTAVKLGDDEIAYFLRAETLRYRGDLERALADYDHFLAIHPIQIPAMVGRALVFEKMGNIAQAKAEFEKALNTESPFVTAKVEAEPARETARARLAAYASGDSQPVIPAAPTRVTSANSIPTPALVAPILKTPVKLPSQGAAISGQGRRVALVIGNSAYEKVPALENPQKDAEAVATSLRNIGFATVTLAANASREKLISGLRAFADEADKADWAVVYYAGHGIEVNGQNYLIPIDAVLKTDRDIQFEAIPLDQVMASIDGAKKLKLVILDACRDNPFAPQIKKTAAPDTVAAASTAGGNVGTRSIGRGLGEVKVQGASLVVFAAKHGQTALDGEGGNSPFAVAMVQRIATPGVEINKIFRLVRDDVMEASAGRQEPYTYGSLPGKEDFFFVASK